MCVELHLHTLTVVGGLDRASFEPDIRAVGPSFEEKLDFFDGNHQQLY